MSKKDVYLTPAECRAGRAWLDWSQTQLAEAAQLNPRTVMDFERGARMPNASTLLAMRLALEAKGIEFSDSDASVILRPADD